MVSEVRENFFSLLPWFYGKCIFMACLHTCLMKREWMKSDVVGFWNAWANTHTHISHHNDLKQILAHSYFCSNILAYTYLLTHTCLHTCLMKSSKHEKLTPRAKPDKGWDVCGRICIVVSLLCVVLALIVGTIVVKDIRLWSIFWFLIFRFFDFC